MEVKATVRNNKITVSVSMSRHVEDKLQDLIENHGFANRSDAVEALVAMGWGAMHRDEFQIPQRPVL